MTKEDLFFRKMGSGHPLIVLHGLYGSGSNWLSIAKELSGICEVFLVDQRNHGQSPHFKEHNYLAMREDLRRFMDKQGLEKAILLGHSMGGKTAQFFATEYPGRVSRLIVADMSPLAYERGEMRDEPIRGHEKIMKALLALDLSKMEGLREVDQALESELPDKRLRQFLLKNLGKDDEKGYYWTLNLEVLLQSLDNLAWGLNPDEYPSEGFRQFPVLFIKGAQSNYIASEDEKAIKRLFPSSNLVSIRDAGHWLHAEQPELFVSIVKKFLLEF